MEVHELENSQLSYGLRRDGAPTVTRGPLRVPHGWYEPFNIFFWVHFYHALISKFAHVTVPMWNYFYPLRWMTFLNSYRLWKLKIFFATVVLFFPLPDVVKMFYQKIQPAMFQCDNLDLKWKYFWFSFLWYLGAGDGFKWGHVPCWKLKKLN